MIRKTYIFISWLATLLLLSPATIYAQSEAEAENPIVPSPVIITEVQTGSSSGSDEFVELYNTSESTVDVTGWQLRYINASTEGDGTTLIAEIFTQDNQAVILQPQSYYVLHTPSVVLLDAVAGQEYSARLSSASKTIALFAPEAATCQLTVRDAIAWGDSMHGEGEPLELEGSGDKLLVRMVDPDGYYVDNDNNSADFTAIIIAKNSSSQVAAEATPGADNQTAQPTDADEYGSVSDLSPIDIAECELPSEDTEQLDEPEIPQTTEQPPSVVIDDSEDSQQDVPSIPARDIGLTAPQLTELLPNPAKPQTDADDEFIELYNPNDAVFELSGFILKVGSKSYVFPDGVLLQPKSFAAFYSAETKLKLSNTKGQAFFFDPLGRQIGQTDTYQTAKDGLSWSLANGKWQWTTVSTPGQANVIKAVASKTTSKTSTSSNTKTTSSSVKGTSTGDVQASEESSEAGEAANKSTSIHTVVLVIIAFFALLYGVYEYRQDLANRIRQLRSYRKARRKVR